METMDRRLDLVLALGIVGIGVFILWASQRISPGSLPDPLGSDGLPNLMGGFLVAAGLVLAGRRVVEFRRGEGPHARHEGKPDLPDHVSRWWRPFLLAALVYVQFLQLERVGYLLPTAVVFAIGLRSMGHRTRALVVGLPVGFAVATWVMFSQALNIPLPALPAVLGR